MVDFRFHLFTVMALFLALGVGMLLGTVVADNQVFAEKESLILGQLEKDFTAMRQRENQALARVQVLERELAQEKLVSRAMVPFVIKGRLVGRRVAVLSAEGQVPRDMVIRILTEAGAEVVTDPWDDISHGGGTPSFDSLVLLSPGRKVRSELEALWTGVSDRLSRQGVVIVGAEASDAQASMTRFFERLGVDFADHVDQPAGQVALVYLLLGAHGHYGVKPGAVGLIPPLSLAEEGAMGGGR